jgi:hypothetical protein
MDSDEENERAWQRAVMRYRRDETQRDYIGALRARLIAMGPPPSPPPLHVSLGTLQWFQQLWPTSLDGLDDLLKTLPRETPGTGGQHGKGTRQRPRNVRGPRR